MNGTRRPVIVFTAIPIVAFLGLFALGVSGVVMPRLLIGSTGGPVIVDGVAHHRVIITNDAPTSVRIDAVRSFEGAGGCEGPKVMIGTTTPYEVLVAENAPTDPTELRPFEPTRLGSLEGMVVYWEAEPGSSDAVEVVASGRSGLRRTIRTSEAADLWCGSSADRVNR